MTEKEISSSNKCSSTSSFLDESFSLLYQKFLGESVQQATVLDGGIEQNEPEHHDTTLAWWNVEEVDDDDSVILNSVALACEPDDRSPASCSLPSARKQPGEDSICSLFSPTSYTAGKPDLNLKTVANEG